MSRPVKSMLIVELVAVLVVGCTLAAWIRRGMARIDALRAEHCRARQPTLVGTGGACPDVRPASLTSGKPEPAGLTTAPRLTEIGDLPSSVFRQLHRQARTSNAMPSVPRWFQLYLPRKAVERLVEQGDIDDTISSVRDITVMFTDIAGFSSVTRGGIAASSIYEIGGFYRSDDGVSRCNLQVHVAPIYFEESPRGLVLAEGYSVHISQLHPQSRGEVRLRSSDPFAAPAISFRLLENEGERREFRDGIRRLREIVRGGELGRLTASELAPGEAWDSDDALDRFVRENAQTEYHPSCTCRMGYDEMAVVDPTLRVRGLAALRVVDASVMPSVVSANLNGPTVMIADKAADMTLGKEPLPAARLRPALLQG